MRGYGTGRPSPQPSPLRADRYPQVSPWGGQEQTAGEVIVPEENRKSSPGRRETGGRFGSVLGQCMRGFEKAEEPLLDTTALCREER